MTDDLARLDAVAQAALVRSGEVSPLELVDAAIGRIEALNPQLNAVIHERFERARDEAASPDLPDGPFRGVPFLLKDLWPTSAGDPFHMGIKAFKEAGYIHPEDANLTKRYREAGFVIVGRTNTPELGLVATTEPLAYGPTHNPWNLDHGPGGSSGGSAAAVASGMVPCANASDGGGSIRIPAAMCGLVGLKPSRGRGSMGPLRDEWGVSVQHVVSHSVRDTAAVLDATWAPFPGDGVIAPAPGRPWLDEIGVTEPLRIGVLDHALGGVPTHAECSASARRGAELAAALGHHVEEAYPAEMDRMAEHGPLVTTMWAVGATASLLSLAPLLGRDLTEDDVEPGTWALAEWGNSASAVELASAQGKMAVVRRDLGRVVGGLRPADHPDHRRAPTALGPAGGHRRRAAAGPDRLDALRHLHRGVQPERSARHLAAPAPDSRWPAGRHPVRGRLRPGGPAHPHRGPARGRGRLGR